MTTVSVEQQVLDAIRRGFRVVPIPYKCKAPIISGWTNLNINENNIGNYFNHGEKNYNYGIAWRDGLVDVDLDCDAAIIIAKLYLPETYGWGRQSRKDSHYIYKAIGECSPKQYKHSNMLLEIRSNGQQTIGPGSTHPSGEIILESSSTNTITCIRADDLIRNCDKIASAALLAQEWNNFKGQRNYLTLHLAGALLHSGWTENQVEKFICAVLEAANDPEIKSRIKNAKATIKKYTANEPVTGWPKLAEIIGDERVNKLVNWLDINFNKTLTTTNKKQNASFNESWLETRKLSDVQPEEKVWIWLGVLALGKLLLIAGPPGKGKTTVCLDIAARCSRGGLWPLSNDHAQECEVALFISEDDIADHVIHILNAHGADLDKIHEVQYVANKNKQDTVEDPFALDRHVDLLEQLFIEHPKIKLVIIDTLKDFVGEINTNHAHQIRFMMRPFVKLLRKHKVAAIATDHINKSSGKSAIDRISGASTFACIARTVFGVKKDEYADDERNICLFCRLKTNMAPGEFVLRYELVDFNGSQKIKWSKGPNGLDIDDFFEKPSDDDKSALGAAVKWIGEYLGDGIKPSKEVYEAAKLAGHSKRTLDTAKKQLNIKPKNVAKTWYWVPPHIDFDKTMIARDGYKESLQSCNDHSLSEENKNNIAKNAMNVKILNKETTKTSVENQEFDQISTNVAKDANNAIPGNVVVRNEKNSEERKDEEVDRGTV